MLEIRKLVGLSLQQHNALFEATLEVREMLSTERVLRADALPPKKGEYFILGGNCYHIEDGKRINHAGIDYEYFSIKRTWYDKRKGFTVLLFIAGNGNFFAKAFTSRASADANISSAISGALLIGPAIRSRINYALGRITKDKIEPFYFECEK